MYQLLYLSQVAPGWTPARLEGLRQASALRNERADLTSLLLHWNGCFLQLLEGRQDAVESAFERISVDPRHHAVSVIAYGIIPQRRMHDALRLVDLDQARAAQRVIRTRHPPLCAEEPHYRDPMLAFSTLYDLQRLLEQGLDLAA